MHRRIAIVSICLMAFSAQAEDGQASGVDWLVGAGVGITELKFTQKLDADASFNTCNLFASAGLDRSFATIAYSGSLSDEGISEEDELGTADRRDLDITLGYQLNDTWTVFIGYKDGETKLDWRVRDENDRFTESYAEDGPYVGASYAFDLGQAGTLSLSAAYIKFDSDLEFFAGVDDEDEDEPLEFDDLTGRISGDSDGYSVGISWTMPVADNIAVRAQYNINDYDLEVKSGGRTFDAGQKLTYLDIGLMLAF